MRLLVLAATLAILASGCASPAHDEVGLDRRWDDTVYTTILPYAWSADIDGDGMAGGFSADAEEGQSETVLGGRIETYLDRVSLVLDGFWLHTGSDPAGFEADVRYGRFDLSVAMRVLGEAPGPVSERTGVVSPYIDGIAGIRSHFAGLNADPPGFEIFDQDLAWIEPMVGARAGIRLFRRLTVFGRVDASGLAYEGWSASSYGAEAGIRFDIAFGLGAFIGTRWARVRASEDSDDDGFDETELDLRLDGIWGGIVLEF